MHTSQTGSSNWFHESWKVEKSGKISVDIKKKMEKTS